MSFESIGRKRSTSPKLVADCCPGHTNYGHDTHEWKRKQSRSDRRNAKQQLAAEVESELIALEPCPDCKGQGVHIYRTHDGGEIEIDCHC